MTSEAILAFRLIRREQELRSAVIDSPPHSNSTEPLQTHGPARGFGPWSKAIRQESAKWGLFLTMIVFIYLLKDQVAEVLAGLSFLVWVVLNRRTEGIKCASTIV